MNRSFLLAALLAAASAPLQAQALLYTLNGSTCAASFGLDVSGVPDVDGDGRGDLLVGAAEGTACVYRGTDGALLHTLVSPGGSDAYAVAGLPDLNGDGRGDVLVGERFDSQDAYAAGRAYVYSGGPGTLRFTLVSPDPGENGFFGWAVSGVPDVDGDGASDLLVGAPGEQNELGHVYIFSGATGTRLRTLETPCTGECYDFGTSLAGLPDLNGDGRGDLLVGERGRGFLGRAYVFSGATGTRLRTLTSPDPAPVGAFGFDVARVPDVDGDGAPDLAVGEPGSGGISGNFPGQAHVFGVATGSATTMTHPDPEPRAYFGRSIAGVEDVDGDGRGDLLVGASDVLVPTSGDAYVMSGANGQRLFTLDSPSSFPMQFGYAVATVGDVDGDGHEDLFIAEPGRGRAHLFSSAPEPQGALTATPLNSPVPLGSTLRFTVTLENNTGATLIGDLVLDVTDPEGGTYTRLLQDDGVLGPHRTATRRYGVPVWETAPLGIYDATVSAVDDQGNVAATDAFTFEVVAGALTRNRGTEGGALGPVITLDGPAAPATAFPQAAALSPNPASARAVLAFTLEAPSAVRLALYDVLGREVAVLADGHRAAGAHAVALDVSALPAGVYLWRLAAGERDEWGRLTVAR
jgi:hypothetical protein